MIVKEIMAEFEEKFPMLLERCWGDDFNCMNEEVKAFLLSALVRAWEEAKKEIIEARDIQNGDMYFEAVDVKDIDRLITEARQEGEK